VSDDQKVKLGLFYIEVAIRGRVLGGGVIVFSVFY
jgi:hypothetical protein